MITTKNKISGILLILLFIGQTSFATIYETTKNGNFNTNNTWTPSKPNLSWGFTDTIYIKHKITFTSAISAFGHFEVTANGEINASNRQMTVKEGATLINHGLISINKLTGSWNHDGIINYGTIDINSTLINNEGTITNNGTITVNSNFTNSYDGIFINNGTLNAYANLVNRNNFTGSGEVNVRGNLTNDWSCTFNITGNITVDGKFNNKGNTSIGGTIDIGGDVVNNWASTIVFNDSASIGGKLTNKGPFTANSSLTSGEITTDGSINLNGTTTVNGNFTNKSDINNTGDLSINGNYTNNQDKNLTNSGTLNISGNLLNKGDINNSGIAILEGNLINKNYIEVSNGSVLYVKGSLDNISDINNNGNLYVDDEVTGTGDIDGAGTLCNSDGLTDPTNGAKLNTVSCDICGDDPNALPVQLISFTAENTNSSVTLSWTTATEDNNDYFEVLRSVDGKSFEIVAEVAGAGNSNVTLDYSVIDTDVENNTYYYMLKQTDYDSKFTISEMVTVRIDSEINTKIYPNPIPQGEPLNIEFESLNNNQITIYDINGRALITINSNAINETIDTSEFAPGIYMVHIQSGTQTKIEKLIVQ